MGFQIPTVIVDLDFAGTPYRGAEVQIASLSLGQLLNLGDQPDRLRAGAGLSQVRELIELFAAKLRSWNLEDELSQALPMTVDAVLSLDFAFAGQMVRLWLDALTNVDDDLGKGSTSGRPSAPPNLPMEAL